MHKGGQHQSRPNHADHHRSPVGPPPLSPPNMLTGGGGHFAHPLDPAGGHREFTGIYESAHFQNIFVEFDTDTKEMAVDVPDHFAPTAKTPPKFPPPFSNSHSTGSLKPYHQFGSNAYEGAANSRSGSLTLSNGTTSLGRTQGNRPGSGTSSQLIKAGSPAASPSAQTLPSRNHLRIEEDGTLRNTSQAPPVPAHGRQPSADVDNSITTSSPTLEESIRIQRYENERIKRAAEMDKRNAQNELLRNSIRNSAKLRALKEQQRASLEGNANSGFSGDGSLLSGNSSLISGSTLPGGPLALSNHSPTSLLAVIDRIGTHPDWHMLLSQYPGSGEGLAGVRNLLQDKRFQESLQFAQKVEKSLDNQSTGASGGEGPASIEIQEVTEECIHYLSALDQDDRHDPDAAELRKLLSRNWIEGLLYAHDKIATRRMTPTSASASVSHGHGAHILTHAEGTTDALLERLSHYAEPNIKIVRIEKTIEPLGATVKNEDDAVIVGRIIRGGMAEASGLLHEGDEILEVNEVELRGKDVNEVCDILGNMHGTLTFLVVPTRRHLSSPADRSQKCPVVHVKAHIDYDPEDDPYVPCRELGISFQKGDILHVVNQRDAHWWQARREGEEDQALPGLVPSAHFWQQKQAMEHTIALDVSKKDGGPRSLKSNLSSGLLCAKRSGRGKKRKGHLDTHGHLGHGEELDPSDPENFIAYEEVALYYPRAERKRPVVLIGPPNIGRHELRHKLMLDVDRFQQAIPHTSRPKRADEIDGQDYHFISRLQFEQDIVARRFVEHGEYEKAYYGTSLEAIRSVVFSEKICVLNLHPQCLKMLKSSDLMPYVVFVAPPSLDKLKKWKMEHNEPVNDDQLKDIIERARDMESTYGHYFDMFITYSDPERAYQQLLSAINALEREPQWVPVAWLLNNIDM